MPSTTGPETTDYDVVVVGAGFAGLYALYELRRRGLNVRVIEAADGVGGTWFWNRYPGARCDVESFDYQFSFSEDLVREWVWSERYPRQEELLAYLNHVADRFELRPDIQLGTRVSSAVLDERSGRWTVTTDRDEHLSAKFVIMATGCLSTARLPDVEGLDSFTGDWYHTGAWPHEGVDFTGKRVAVIGTGSSGIQSIPVIAEQAEQLFVLQRTANYSVPAFNRELSDADRQACADNFPAIRQFARQSMLGGSWSGNDVAAMAVTPEERQAIFEKQWEMGGLPMYVAFTDLLVDQRANDSVKDFIADKIRQRVSDPAIAEKLTPSGYPLGGKRICVDIDYFETFNRDNVELVDVKANPIERITPRGILVGDTELAVDTIVFATGFDAMTGALLSINIEGRGGRTLREKWHAGPATLLGLAVSGFPNMFLVTGPGSPSVFSNMVVSIEQHVDWIAEAIDHLRSKGLQRMEALPDAESAWVDHVNEVADTTLLPQADSWYTGANVPGKPRVFMPYVGGCGLYRQKCDEVAADGYAGFSLTP
ncbi:MAG TPA: NAD(P)/FAD-dependent oxidoreductase [Pseudonocardia sp.]|jgi:cyclohexanone monooxygenase|nr:NAD(P)/FAD-dependent oxidoreductase [Pseudonocardia sp.]